MNAPCFRCYVGQHDRCEGIAHPTNLPAHPCICDGCNLTPTPAPHTSPGIAAAPSSGAAAGVGQTPAGGESGEARHRPGT